VFIDPFLAAVKLAVRTGCRSAIRWCPLALACAVVLVLASVSCERRGGTGAIGAPVVVYSSVDEVYARPVLEAFTKQTGVVIKLVSDTEETKSTGLLNRLLAERSRPQADVFWSGDPIRAGVLMARNVSEPYRSPQAAGQSNRVEWTGELTPTSVWTTVVGAANVPGTGSVAQVIEIDGATLPQRFYRIRRLP